MSESRTKTPMRADDVRKKDVDMETLQAQFRGGILSLRAIADEHGISQSTVTYIARSNGWTRDLGARIRAAAADRVARATEDSTLLGQDEEEGIIAVNAEMQAKIIRSHRVDIGRSRAVTMLMLGELEETCRRHGDFEALAETMEGAEGRRAAEIFRRAVSLHDRVDSGEKLARTLKLLVGLERQAYGIDVEAKAEEPELQGESLSMLLKLKLALERNDEVGQ